MPKIPSRTITNNSRINVIDSSLKHLIVDIGGLKLDPNNARLHPERSLESIRESLKRFGQRKPIVVRRETMIVVAGNGTLEAARALGWTRIAASIQDMTEAEAASYGLADNRTAELSRFDYEVVARLERLIADAGQEVVGWTAEELVGLRHVPSENGEDQSPEEERKEWNVVVVCTSLKGQLELADELESRGYKCQIRK